MTVPSAVRLVGAGDGRRLGSFVGARLVGVLVGSAVVGCSVVGTFVGVSVGGTVGPNEGVRVGFAEGWSVGCCDFGAPANIRKQHTQAAAEATYKECVCV